MADWAGFTYQSHRQLQKHSGCPQQMLAVSSLYAGTRQGPVM